MVGTSAKGSTSWPSRYSVLRRGLILWRRGSRLVECLLLVERRVMRLYVRSSALMRVAIVTSLLTLGSLAGCDQFSQAPTKRENPCAAVSRSGDPQRFKTVEVYPVGMRQNLALDSHTGQMCRTWNWQTNGGRSPSNHFPTCASPSGQPEGEPGLIAGQ